MDLSGYLLREQGGGVAADAPPAVIPHGLPGMHVVNNKGILQRS